MTRQSRFFYGWVIVGSSIAAMALVYGVRHTFGVFFSPILDEFGWSRGSTALMLSLNILVYGLVAPIGGSLGDRWKPKRLMPIGVTILGLATVGCAFARELWHFYLLFGVVMPVGTAFCGWPLLAPILANWFSKRRGLAIGLGQMGGGFSFTYGIFAEFLISQLGWRGAYLVIAAVLAVVVLPVYVFLIHYRPEDKGLKAYGTAEVPAASSLEPVVTVVKDLKPHDWTLGRAMKTHQLWLLVASDLLYWGIAGYLVMAHQVKFAVDIGYSSVLAASVLGLFGIFSAVGMLFGFLSDWLGREVTFSLATFLSVGALVALLSVSDPTQAWLLYVFAICFGFGSGLCAPTIVAGTADLFHGRHFGAIAALLLTGVGIGGAIGPWLGGYIYDVTGSYVVAFFLCIGCCVLGCIAFWMAAPRNAARLKAEGWGVL